MNFIEWKNQNIDKLTELLKDDAEEALFAAFLAGMEYMGTGSSRVYYNGSTEKD